MPTVKFGSCEFECSNMQVVFPERADCVPIEPAHVTLTGKACDVMGLLSREMYVDGRHIGDLFVTKIDGGVVSGMLTLAKEATIDQD